MTQFFLIAAVVVFAFYMIYTVIKIDDKIRDDNDKQE